MTVVARFGSSLAQYWRFMVAQVGLDPESFDMGMCAARGGNSGI